jgi:DNA-binding MarR family transcriptional regulator
VPSFDSELRLVIQRIARRIRSETAGGELSDGKRSVLFRLDEHSTLSLGALSELEHVTPPSMNRAVGVLIERGLVTRATASDDARKVAITLTPDGVAWVAETRRRRDAWMAERLATLTADERAALDAAVPVLKKLGS